MAWKLEEAWSVYLQRAFLYTAVHVIAGNKRLTVKTAAGRVLEHLAAKGASL